MPWIYYAIAGTIFIAAGIYLGLPHLLRAFGLHPHYEIPPMDLDGKSALIITTSQKTLGEGGKATGVFGSEMSVPYFAFLDAGMRVELASIKGGEIPVEPWSMAWPLATAADRRFRGNKTAMKKLKNSVPIGAIDPKKYDIIFLSGGWGAAYDFGLCSVLGDLLTVANAKGAVLGGVCHGPLGLLQAKDIDGKPLVEGRHLAAVSDRQVAQLGINDTPMHPERDLRAAGAIYQAKSAFRDMLATHVVVDGHLVTGQNQNSGAETAHRMMELLKN